MPKQPNPLGVKYLEKFEAMLVEELELAMKHGTLRERAALAYEIMQYLEGGRLHPILWYSQNGLPEAWARDHRTNLFRWKERKRKLGL